MFGREGVYNKLLICINHFDSIHFNSGYFSGMKIVLYGLLLMPLTLIAQRLWVNKDSAFGPLPKGLHVYYSDAALDGQPFRAYYVRGQLKEKNLQFDTDSTTNRRLTPQQFYERNNQPFVVVNGTFFSFTSNKNLNTLIKGGKILAHDEHIRALKGTDTLLYHKHLASAIGITKRRKADVAWVYNGQRSKHVVAFQNGPEQRTDSINNVSLYTFAPEMHHLPKTEKRRGIQAKWRVQTAIGGGPVLLHDGAIRITNNEEGKFVGKAINDKHPRTAMGYTADGNLIILVVEGRNPSAGGASLLQLAQLMKELGCVEALNLDGGGSTCLLINGKETVKPSDKEGQRPVPGVFLIRIRN